MLSVEDWLWAAEVGWSVLLLTKLDCQVSLALSFALTTHLDLPEAVNAVFFVVWIMFYFFLLTQGCKFSFKPDPIPTEI